MSRANETSQTILAPKPQLPAARFSPVLLWQANINMEPEAEAQAPTIQQDTPIGYYHHLGTIHNPIPVDSAEVFWSPERSPASEHDGSAHYRLVPPTTWDDTSPNPYSSMENTACTQRGACWAEYLSSDSSIYSGSPVALSPGSPYARMWNECDANSPLARNQGSVFVRSLKRGDDEADNATMSPEELQEDEQWFLDLRSFSHISQRRYDPRTERPPTPPYTHRSQRICEPVDPEREVWISVDARGIHEEAFNLEQRLSFLDDEMETGGYWPILIEDSPASTPASRSPMLPLQPLPPLSRAGESACDKSGDSLDELLRYAERYLASTAKAAPEALSVPWLLADEDIIRDC
ncbi:hypothetical protein SCP_0306140 [Sparassis crispa]|uniref:Uncharacterized protein n=1 Tax=Sparassis crispa TaxID=139825 RepID=A0A401GFL4_9APHY|nr:hypothetical protein SCP_0306140 [Sparassis crispa]GBE80893.1 hypothetical protein SCP_0306140 [Sparassis crispa]